MRRPARPKLATWLALLALAAQTLAFALHGPLRLLADAGGGTIICTAEGLLRIGTGEPETAPRAADHVCSACATLAAAAVPPAAPIPAAVAFAPLAVATSAAQAILPARPALGPAQPRAPPAWA